MRSSHHTRWCLAALLSVAAATGGSAAGGAVAGAGTHTARTVARPGLPQRLSETGLYNDARGLGVDARNLAFTSQYPLWTDGATKRRWIRLPERQTSDAARIDAWEFPVGTRVWTEFGVGGRRAAARDQDGVRYAVDRHRSLDMHAHVEGPRGARLAR